VVLRLPEYMRTTKGLGDLLIETPHGWIPARQLADIKETDGPNQILRENGRRRLVVLANTDARANLTTIVAEVRREAAASSLPEGYFVNLEGTFQAQEDASRTIGALSVVSLALIFVILYSRYRSTVLSLIVMGIVPLGLIGAVAALWIAGQPLSIASLIGFVTLTGIAARNGILKISHYINLSLHEGVPFGRELVVRGTLERLTPVLMTALAAAVALFPLLIDPSSPGTEILHPVAVTIFGGLISATILDTFLTPILFLKFGQKPLEALRAVTAAASSSPAAATPAAVPPTF
jgi:HME family heavy-metal exporter